MLSESIIAPGIRTGTGGPPLASLHQALEIGNNARESKAKLRIGSVNLKDFEIFMRFS